MYFTGLDLHKKYSQLTVINQEGVIVDSQRIDNNIPELEEFFNTYGPDNQVAMEATYNWYWMADFLEEHDIDHVMSHPTKTKIIGEAKIKTDKIDSVALAQLLRTGYLPIAHIADKEARDEREWLRYRCYLVILQTSLKNRIHCILDKHNIQQPYSDLFGVTGKEFLKTVPLPTHTREVVDQVMRLEESLEKQLKGMRNFIKRAASHDERLKILTSIPGIGYITAYMLLVELQDFNRFSHVGKLLSYCGMVPSVQSSGGKTWYGHLTKQGNRYIRSAMVIAANSVVHQKKDRRLMRIYEKVKSKKGGSVAKVAVAKEILSLAYHCVRKGVVYDPNILYRRTEQ